MSDESAWKRIEAAAGAVVKVTEEEYYEALEVLPPIYLRGSSWFAVSEANNHDRFGDPIFYCFARIRGKFYGVLESASFAKKKFNEKLETEKLYAELTT